MKRRPSQFFNLKRHPGRKGFKIDDDRQYGLIRNAN